MEFEVIRSRRRTMAAEIKGVKLIIRAPLFASDGDVQRFLLKNQKWIESHLAEARAREEKKQSVHILTDEEIRLLAEKAKREIPLRVAYYAPIVGITYGRITIRNQRSKWGSCSAAGNLNFNCLLMLAPPEVLDYVVVHELAHFYHMDHSKAFWSTVESVLPDYETHRRWLNEHGQELRV